jgi:hypothetical protein
MGDAACRAAITTAMDYVGKKTQDWPSEHRQTCRHDPCWVALGDAMCAQAQTGNLKATQAACRAWWTYVLACAPVEVHV